MTYGIGGVCPELFRENAPVAQLDRASDYESEGRTFESFRARHFRNLNKIEFALSNAPSRGRSRGKLLGTRERGGNAGIIRVTRQGAGLPRTSPRMRTSDRALGIPQ